MPIAILLGSLSMKEPLKTYRVGHALTAMGMTIHVANTRVHIHEYYSTFVRCTVTSEDLVHVIVWYCISNKYR